MARTAAGRWITHNENPRNHQEAALSAIPCRLLYRSTSPHLQQLYTGFLLLHQSGFIRLSQQVRRTECKYENDAPHLRAAGHAHLDAVLNENVRVHFDTHDAKEIATGELEDCDLYFKRSYSPQAVAALPESQRRKVRPLGLNYRVLPSGLDRFAIARSLSLGGFSAPSASALKQALDFRNLLGFQPRLWNMESPPHPDAAPRVLFLVAAYDPYDDPARSPDKIEDRIHINEMRAHCIRLLRAALGNRFNGGFSRSRFSLEHYGDLVAPPEATSQENYLQSLKSHSICVASSGLHGSTGWKFAEYIAFAKAIVSEKLAYEVPEGFASGQNYLEFTSAQDCVNSVIKLVEDASLRRELMRNNAAYYRSQLRPDALVRNALRKALAGT